MIELILHRNSTTPHATNPSFLIPSPVRIAPALGTLIKLHFGGQLRGPGSMQSLTRSQSRIPAPALVLGAHSDVLPSGRCILISLHRSADSGENCGIRQICPSTTDAPTPTLSGDPLTAGGYINDRVSSQVCEAYAA